VVETLLETQPELQQNFSKSVFPSVAFNLGPRTICFLHRDAKNVPYGLCPVTSFGSFDPTKGGHLVLWELKLVIEFPPGTTILLPSATIGHSNTPIQEGETRFSLTQYCPGGLVRWVKYGCRSRKSYSTTTDGKEWLKKFDSEDEKRRKHGLSLFSRYQELESDATVVRKRRQERNRSVGTPCIVAGLNTTS
jgi:hypothetical protein